MKVKVVEPFFDESEAIDRKSGDIFEAEEDRIAHIEAVLPGFIERIETAPEPVSDADEDTGAKRSARKSRKA